MRNESLFTRRKMLQATGSSLLVGLAGCSSSQTNGGSTAAADTHTEQHTEESSETGDHDEEGSHSDSEGDHGGDSHGHDEAISAPTETAEVKMLTQDGGYHFDPHVVRVKPGGTVSWVLASGSHTTTAYHPDNDQPQLVPDGAATWDSDTLSNQGESFEHTFETEGVYHYYCSPHESVGMIGSVIVGEPDAHGQPALEEPPQDKPEAVRTKIEDLNAMCNEALGHSH
ncbi:plastocyanin/azurin family copper-binding protein [Haloarculaceae archaeon H-GB2-1]|nr:plastocyanin/azurin family copper-binding protein [Haloarculaceae archaeon H-GB1-1]MEA5387744.1 plastocyanin/azurin family copper-binding protein [Haloarculaceae archaeon H-GB11]MEA5409236.1 plastocyanin/azurin family copper-binding protein [Haloarculaceae archaeon H-GB2-1]